MKLSNKSAVFLGLAFATFAVAGCSENQVGEEGTTYCDDDGCFVCDPGATACWPMEIPECDKASDCGPGQACSAIGCVDRCAADDGCDRGLKCNEGLCVPPGYVPETPTDGDPAPDTPDTSDTSDTSDAPDVEGPCESDDNCQEGFVCIQETGDCIPRCGTDDDCVTGEVCLPCGKCQKEELPATCGSTPDYCDESDASSCGSGKACVAGRCHYQCEVGFACPVGQVCAEDGLCRTDVDPATVQCHFDFECDAGACINGTCHAECTLSADCGDTMVCLMGLCQPDFRPTND
jgi:hypothetical protein